MDLADIPRIVAELTLEEKSSLCSGGDFWHTKAVGRLGVPAIMVADGPHGLRKQPEEVDHLGLAASVPATCFPTAAGLGSSWDPELMLRVGEALGVEARAAGVAVLLGPGVNMKRTPLCGRNFEYVAEDPLLAGELASALVAGIQRQGVGASLKHFAANNQETDRMRVSVEVDERTLREIYLPAFERVVKQAKPLTVMCAYNKLDGTFCSENRRLLTAILRDEWGFDGLVVSDWGAVDDRVAGVAAGLDLEMPASGGRSDADIVAAVRDGALAEADLDRSVERLLTLIVRTQDALAAPGSFDPGAHHDLAVEAATRTAVLLKNDGVLPLALDDDVVILGEMARTPRYQGAGSSQVNPTRLTSALEALTTRRDVPFAPGYTLAEATQGDATDAELCADAVSLSRGKTAVLFLGLPAADESEGYDRSHLDLPDSHVALLRAVRAVARRTVVALANGSAVAADPWQADADAILELWLGGQGGGEAAVRLLTGEVAPSGRLAESLPRRLADVPAQLNFPGERGVVRYGEGPHIGYRGLDAVAAEVSYPFGHGLTYTTFAYSDLTTETLEVTSDTAPDAVVLRVRARVTNTGEREGVAVPQLYVGKQHSCVRRVPRELKGFARVELAPGASEDVAFALTRRDLSFWDVARDGWSLERGEYVVAVGASSRDLPMTEGVTVTAPSVDVPLTDHSTVAEWLADPVGGPLLRTALGATLEMFEGSGAEAAYFADLPVVKVPSILGGRLSVERLEEVLAAAGAARA